MARRSIPVLVLALASGGLAAQQPVPFDAYRASMGTALQAYADPAIQAELKLSDDQKAKIAKIPDELLAKHKDAVEKEKAARKEASDKRAATQAELEKKLDALVEKHLTAGQRKRLGQLVVQEMGLFAFSDPEVTRQLSLPADARAKLDELRSDGAAKLNKEFPDFGPPLGRPDSDERRKYAEAQRKINLDLIARFVGTFTDDQKKAWKELAGEPSDAVSPVGVGTIFGGGPFGFGGFPGSRLSARAGLLANEKVVTELKVEKASRDGLAAGLKELRDASRAGTAGGFGGASLQLTLRQEAAKLAGEVLTPAQAKRLEQIQFQLLGTGVFTAAVGPGLRGGFDPFSGTALTVNPLTKLTLTPAQVVKIDAVLADAAAQRGTRGLVGGGGFIPGGPDRTEEQKARLEAARKAAAAARQKAAEIDKAALAEVLATFDAGQKAVWKEFTGEPFDTSKAPQNFGPLFGGRGGPRGGTGTGATVWTREASLRLNRGEYAAALAAYDEAIRLAPTNTTFLQQKANLLATCPSEWVRDGKQAVEIMQKVTAAGGKAPPAQHLILAAAYAETGKFDEAVKAQQNAIDMLPKDDDADGFGTAARPQYEARLKLYQEKKPYRMPAPRARP